jgi:class 3 adenylate cyclase
MPLYMDRHDIEGVTAKAVAEAHEKDLAVQDKYGVKYLTYWSDEARGRVFCLVDAPDKEKAVQVHREAHGLIPSQIIEVEPAIVGAFLGTIEEPPPLGTIVALQSTESPATASETPGDSAFRAILFTDMKGSTTLTRQLGDAKAMELLRTHNAMIRDVLKTHGGREVKHTGDGFMASFASVSHAVECAIAILKAFDSYNRQNPETAIHLRIGLSAGEPVTEGQDLFGATVQLASRLCDRAQADQILVSSVVRELCLGKKLPFKDQRKRALKGFDRPMHVYEVEWSEA